MKQRKGGGLMSSDLSMIVSGIDALSTKTFEGLKRI